MFMYHQWLSLPLNVRNAIATQFGIAKTGPTHVFDNRIESDGYRVIDVETALNVDAIQKYTGSDSTNLTELWEALIAKIEGRDVPPAELMPHIVIDEDTPVETKPVKRTYKKRTK